jgi:purine-binding chemotaxis protein CheW
MQACLRFRVGHVWYALPVRHIIEVVSLVAVKPLPESPAHVLGVITVRGRAVNVLDMRQLLGHTPEPLTLSSPLIVLKPAHGAPFAALVDEVDNVIPLPEELERLPSSGHLLAGIARYQHELLLVMEVDALGEVLAGKGKPTIDVP